MDVLSLGAMCRYSDVSRLNWGNVEFAPDLRFLVITFEIRKNSQFRQGNKVTVVATNDIIYHLQLLLKLNNGDVNHLPSSPIYLLWF